MLKGIKKASNHHIPSKTAPTNYTRNNAGHQVNTSQPVWLLSQHHDHRCCDSIAGVNETKWFGQGHMKLMALLWFILGGLCLLGMILCWEMSCYCDEFCSGYGMLLALELCVYGWNLSTVEEGGWVGTLTYPWSVRMLPPTIHHRNRRMYLWWFVLYHQFSEWGWHLDSVGGLQC